jgi:hypothetical protein
MENVVPFQLPEAACEAEPPKRHAIRRPSGFLASALTFALSMTAAFSMLLAAAILFYDGPLLSFGPGGLWVGHAPDPAVGRVALFVFSFWQRLAGAFAVLLLTAPIIFIFHHARALFRLYAAGTVFAPACARRIKLMGVGLIFYSVVPFVANRAILIAGVTNDPVWFHLDEVTSLLFGALAFVIANVMEFGHEIEQERDGFI